MLTRSKAGIFKKKAFLTTSPTIPQTFKQALVDQNWRATMDVEYQALLRNNIWTLVPPPSYSNIIRCKWIFKLKHNSDDSIEHYKACLVAKGFNQTHGINYSKTFSPVVKPFIVWIILSLPVASQWPIRQLDVQNAFLNRELQEQVLMTQPPGFENHQTPDSVYCLNKALYGLKHASWAWFTKLIHYLIIKGFQCSRANSSPFFQYSVIDMLLLLIYVDDILITGSNPSHVSSFIFDPSSPFALRDLGNLHNFLGVEVIQQSSTLYLNQCRYIQQFLKRNNMLNTKLANTPGALGKQLSTADGEFLSDASLYKSTVGALSYVTLTPPNISFFVNKACQLIMTHPTNTYWLAVERNPPASQRCIFARSPLSSFTISYSSRLHKCGLGILSWWLPKYWRILLISWAKSHFMVIHETKSSIPQ